MTRSYQQAVVVMFVRAGLTSRVLRGDGDAPVSAFFGRPKKKKPKEKFKCYIPFMWPACVALGVGTVVLAGGTALAVTGYFAHDFGNDTMLNSSLVAGWPAPEDRDTRHSLSYLIYVGPITMGFGCITIVIACVVVCETRDKMLRIMAENKRRGRKTRTKPDFYDLVIKNFKRRAYPRVGAKVPTGEPANVTEKSNPPAETPAAAAGSRKEGTDRKRRRSLFQLLNVIRRASVRSTKSDYVHIMGALRQIPQQIFSIDMDTSRETSLLPVIRAQNSLRRQNGSPGRLSGRRSICLEDLPLPVKYPSASCLPDLLKLREDKLEMLFPDMHMWLRSPQPIRIRPPTARLTPQPRATVLYENERKDHVDSCEVTIHAANGSRETTPSRLLLPERCPGNVFGIQNRSFEGEHVALTNTPQQIPQYGSTSPYSDSQLQRPTALEFKDRPLTSPPTSENRSGDQAREYSPSPSLKVIQRRRGSRVLVRQSPVVQICDQETLEKRPSTTQGCPPPQRLPVPTQRLPSPRRVSLPIHPDPHARAEDTRTQQQRPGTVQNPRPSRREKSAPANARQPHRKDTAGHRRSRLRERPKTTEAVVSLDIPPGRTSHSRERAVTSTSSSAKSKSIPKSLDWVVDISGSRVVYDQKDTAA